VVAKNAKGNIIVWLFPGQELVVFTTTKQSIFPAF